VLQGVQGASQVAILLGVSGPTGAQILARKLMQLHPTPLPKNVIELRESPHVKASGAFLIALTKQPAGKVIRNRS
jgi:hypothetical protein